MVFERWCLHRNHVMQNYNFVGKKQKLRFVRSINACDDDLVPAVKRHPKKFVVVDQSEQPRYYSQVLVTLEIDLPDPCRYMSIKIERAFLQMWNPCGALVLTNAMYMSAIETIAVNERVSPLTRWVALQMAISANGAGNPRHRRRRHASCCRVCHHPREGVKSFAESAGMYGTHELTENII